MISTSLDYGASSSSSDETLMQAITDRHQPALVELYSRYGGRLRAVIGNVVREEGEADDVLQDIMIQVWQEAGKYSPALGRPLGWVSTVARRRAIDRVRRRQAYSRAKERYAETAVDTSDVSVKTLTDEIAHRDLRQFLDGQIARLPEVQRQAVKLAFFHGMSHREIAATTRTPLGTVKTRLELGLQKLAQAVKPMREKI